MKKSLFCSIILIITICSAPKCQDFEIFYDDSIYVTYDFSVNSLHNSQFDFRLGFDLNEKNLDGEYIVYWIPKSKRRKYCMDRYLAITGQYVDSLREGEFIYYHPPYSTPKKKRCSPEAVSDVLHFKKGLLDGPCMYNAGDGYKTEGFYKEGKKHGFFYTYSYEGKLAITELYMDGICLYCSDTELVSKFSDEPCKCGGFPLRLLKE